MSSRNEQGALGLPETEEWRYHERQTSDVWQMVILWAYVKWLV